MPCLSKIKCFTFPIFSSTIWLPNIAEVIRDVETAKVQGHIFIGGIWAAKAAVRGHDAMSINIQLIMINIHQSRLLRFFITLILGISRGIPRYRHQGRSTKVNIASTVLTSYRKYSTEDEGWPIAGAETRTAKTNNFHKI